MLLHPFFSFLVLCSFVTFLSFNEYYVTDKKKKKKQNNNAAVESLPLLLVL